MADIDELQNPELSPQGLALLRQIRASRGQAAPSALQLQAQNVTPGAAPAPPGWRDVPQAGQTPPPPPGGSYTSNPIGGGMLSGAGRDALMGTSQATQAQDPLAALQEQMGVIERLSGREQQTPQIGTVLDPGSPTYGLLGLGGRMVGPQVAPSLRPFETDVLQGQQALAANRQRPTEALLGRLGEMGRQATARGNLALEEMRLRGTGDLPGQLQVNQSQIEANKLSTQQDLQLANDYRTFMNDPANGRNRAERQRAWDASNMPTPGYAGGAQAPEEGGTPRSRTRPSTETTPESTIQSAYGDVETRYAPETNGRRGPIPAGDATNNAITEMVTRLNQDPQFIGQNRRGVMDFLTSKFGQLAMQGWAEQAANSGLNGLVSTAHGRALRSLNPSGFSRLPTEEEIRTGVGRRINTPSFLGPQ